MPPQPVPLEEYEKSIGCLRILEFLGVKPDSNVQRKPGPAPDGGQAWIQVLVAHLVLFNTWGYINSYGLFESYYVSNLNLSLSDLSWAGSVQVFLLLSIGTFSGRLFDAGYFRAALIVGSIFQLFGVFLTSFATEYWQLFLAQGICGGIGAGIIYCPMMACVSTYFDKKRALAIALTTSGTATGGIVYPIIAQQLLPKVGFGWTVRCMGFVMLFNVAVILTFARTRLPPRKKGPLVEIAAFKEPPYVFFTIGVFLCLWAVYIGYDYINHYATSVVGVSTSTSLTMLLMLNAMGCPGRVFPALVSDAYFGPFNTAIPLIISSGILYFSWIAVKSLASLVTFVVLFGFANGGVQGMLMAGLPSLTSDLSKMGTRTGMVLSIISIATLTGPPLAGALIQRGDGKYLYLQIWGGCSMLMGAVFLMAARVSATGFNLRQRI